MWIVEVMTAAAGVERVLMNYEYSSATATELPRTCHETAWSRKSGGKRKSGRQEREETPKTEIKYADGWCTCVKDKVNPIELIRASLDRRLWHHIVAKVVEDGTAP